MKDPLNLANCTVPPEAQRPVRTETPPVGARLRALRRMRDLTLQQFAKEAGLAYTTAQGAERKGSDPHLSTLVKLCAALGVDPADLLDAERFKATLMRLAEGK